MRENSLVFILKGMKTKACLYVWRKLLAFNLRKKWKKRRTMAGSRSDIFKKKLFFFRVLWVVLSILFLMKPVMLLNWFSVLFVRVRGWREKLCNSQRCSHFIFIFCFYAYEREGSEIVMSSMRWFKVCGGA